MGIFNRRTRPANASPVPAAGEGHQSASREPKMHHRHDNASLNARPLFGQWLKVTWPDILTMIVMGVVGLGIYEAPPAPNRSFPVYFPSGDIVYPEFAYPLRNEVVPIWAAALLAALVPIAVFLFMQIRIRSFWDINNSILGLLYSLITAAVFQVWLKWLIGGLRPHFLEVCKPAVPISGPQTGNGYGQIMYDRKICTGDKNQIDDSLESFPSGHTAAAFGGFVFLYLYLNAKLKVWSNYHPAYWKLTVTYMPILGAVLIGGALTIDEFHNWYDILAGAIIGTVFAFSAYRMVYASVWDFRFNHIPLVRHVPFTYDEGSAAFNFNDAIWTRQAGWGAGDGEGAVVSGAPFDAANIGMSGTRAGLGDIAGPGTARSGTVGGISGRGSGVHRKPVVGSSASGRGAEMV